MPIWTNYSRDLRLTKWGSTSFCAATILTDRCPLWVINGHRVTSASCPLYPRKRTSFSAVAMSALCQKRTSSGPPLAAREVLLAPISQVVLRVDEFEAKRSDGRHLADVFTGFCPMKVVRVARQNDDAAGRIGLKLLGIEPIAEADVENTGDHCVDAILGVFVRHELYP
jgi:hypothetical protein